MTTDNADHNHLIAERREKLNAWRQSGCAFPNRFVRLNTAQSLADAYAEVSADALHAMPAVSAKIAGRMMLRRLMGKAAFATLQDMSGRIQIYLTLADVGDEAFEAFKHWDLGDIVGVSGHLMRTKTGELTVRVSELTLLVKSLRPLPDKFHGLTDIEQKYRKRHIDLIMNEHTQKVFKRRSAIIQHLRHYMMHHGFVEVETPMMHPIPGGAVARPFVTHHNALDQAMYLRIAPELYLKRLVVGGIEKVFEINRNFRNEGLSPRHNPEFTMMEFYEAYADYRSFMDFTEGLLRQVTAATLGSERFVYQGRELDFSHPFARLTLVEAITSYHPDYRRDDLNNKVWLRAHLAELGETPADDLGLGALQLLLFEATTESLLFNPTFIIDYPEEVSPLARRNDDNPEITERFELFIAGREIANGFSELNDPEDQAERFLAQAALREAGDHEAMYYDADYIEALEIGLPPTAGCGIGVDRLVMLLTDAPAIRDVILFPQMRQLEATS